MMLLIILPKNTGTEAVEEAQQKLDAEINNPLTVLMLIYGEGAEIDRAIQICTEAASVKPNIRKVISIPDHTVLTIEQKRRFMHPIKPVVSVGLNNEIAIALEVFESQEDVYVEEAFNSAEAQR